MDEATKREMATALGKAFAEGLAENVDQARERDQARAIAEARNEALRRVRNRFVRERNDNRDRAVFAVGNFCSAAREGVLEKLKNDKRMPRSINYLERYNALLGMDDRREVLARLDQTLAKAEAILDEVGEIDVDGALTGAAASYAERVHALDGITVVKAEPLVEDETAEAPKTPVYKKTNSDEEFESEIDDAFDEAFGEIEDVERQQADQVSDLDARIDKLMSQMEDAMGAAEKTAREAMRRGAESVAGRVLSIPKAPDFDGSVVMEAQLDVDQVRELATEVRTSFKTFGKVVQDNGLFAAFASEGTFGACNGWRFGFWLDDFLYDMSSFEGKIPGRKPVQDIPCSIEEDEGGDSLEKSIERMREFNKRKYFGMLDDEFDGHIEAFWYGFKKLMESVNGLYRMNPAAFNEYCNDIAESAKQATLELGAASMDSHQVDEFCDEVDSRSGE